MDVDMDVSESAKTETKVNGPSSSFGYYFSGGSSRRDKVLRYCTECLGTLKVSRKS